jgi:hypothetical protein
LDFDSISPLVLVTAAMSSIAGAAVQGTIGFGYAIVTVPLLSLLDSRLAPVPQILTTLPLTLVAAWHERGHIEARDIGWILLGRLPGMLLGAILMALTRHTDHITGAVFSGTPEAGERHVAR